MRVSSFVKPTKKTPASVPWRTCAVRVRVRIRVRVRVRVRALTLTSIGSVEDLRGGRRWLRFGLGPGLGGGLGLR